VKRSEYRISDKERTELGQNDQRSTTDRNRDNDAEGGAPFLLPADQRPSTREMMDTERMACSDL
jgi:hypothetical protein